MGGYMNVSVKSLEYRKRQKILLTDRSSELFYVKTNLLCFKKMIFILRYNFL